MMAVFSIPNDQLLLEKVCEYFHVQKQKELDLLWIHLKLKHNNT
jgi:hypothetical protein